MVMAAVTCVPPVKANTYRSGCSPISKGSPKARSAAKAILNGLTAAGLRGGEGGRVARLHEQPGLADLHLHYIVIVNAHSMRNFSQVPFSSYRLAGPVLRAYKCSPREQSL